MNDKDPLLAPVPRVALRAPEAAEALSISARTLADWTRDGTVPFVRINGCLLYPVASLISWLQQQAATQQEDDLGDRGGTECEHAGCGSKASETRMVRGCVRHLCDQHSRRFPEEE